MWRPRPRLRRVLVKLAASRCAGAPLRKARPRQAAFGGPCFAPPPRRLRRRCSGAARPPRCGGCGAVRPSGPVGGASASLASPATPAAQAVPRGSAYALAARRSGPAGLALAHQWAAPSRPAGARPPLRAASSLPACAGRSARAAAAGRNLDRRAHWRRKRRLPRASRAAGRRGTPPAGGSAGRFPGRQGQGKPRAGRQKPPTSGGLACRCPGQRGQNVAGVPPSGGFPPLSHSGKRWCCYVCCCLSYLCFWPGLVAGLPVWWCLWLVAVPVCSVALALCSGGGFCLSVCGGICAGLFLACWCAGRSAGGGSVQIKIPHRVTSPVGDFPANIRRCRPQKTARQKATAHGL